MPDIIITQAKNGWVVRQGHSYNPGMVGDLFVAETPAMLAKLVLELAVTSLTVKK